MCAYIVRILVWEKCAIERPQLVDRKTRLLPGLRRLSSKIGSARTQRIHGVFLFLFFFSPESNGIGTAAVNVKLTDNRTRAPTLNDLVGNGRQ